MATMKIKNIAVIVALCLAVVFLGLDRCGSSRKVDELKGQYEEASRIAKVERSIKEEIIKEQKEKIVVLNVLIEVKNTTIAKKNRELVGIEEELGELKRDFASLEECQAQYDKLVGAFTLCKSINIDKNTLIFSLKEKFDAQVVIGDSYKTMYDTLTQNERKLQSIVTAQDWQIKKLKLTSGLKSGLAVVLAGLIVYNMVK